MDAGMLLRNARIERGLDQAALARRAGTTQTYVSRVERRAVSPSVTTLERLLAAMGQRLALSVEPLPHGNQDARGLRAGLRDLTPEQRVDEAVELSAFLTDVAASAGGSRGSR
jgi:transcriptional regulator with XRE-family HTH domain